MYEIIVLSGKGGTGKTSIAAALATVAGKDIVVADCDVDAANMHLLLEPDFALTEDFYGGLLAVVNHDLCIMCGKCSEVCRFDAVLLQPDCCVINDTDCEGCGYCEKVCPAKAISMQERKSGQVYISKIKTGATMVHAKLDAGGENSGKLVAKVKNEALERAKLLNLNFILVDGSPGIGCPVVSSLSGASLVVLVTEPSFSALNDLKRMYRLLQNFRIPAVCILNKSDIDIQTAAEMKTALAELQIPVFAEIPYNPVFQKALVQGLTVAEYDRTLLSVSLSLWEKIKLHLINNIK